MALPAALFSALSVVQWAPDTHLMLLSLKIIMGISLGHQCRQAAPLLAINVIQVSTME
jgi:hypothetical protein